MRILCILFLLILSSCQQEKSASTTNKSTTPDKPIVQNANSDMAAILKNLYINADLNTHFHLNSRHAERYRQAAQQGDNNNRISNHLNYCGQLLYAGKNQLCLDNLNAFLQKNNMNYDQLLANNNAQLLEIIGMAYLRLGEEQNCQNNHTAYSCILPLQKEGFHSMKNGSTKAIEIFSKIYAKYPTDRHKWLINLAYMTLGQYPQGVPSDLLVPFPNWNQEQRSFPRFKEMAMDLGVAVNGLSGGVCLDDFDNNGYVDIFATSYGMMDQVKLFLNDGKQFSDVTAQAGLNGIVSGLNSIHADYNNDGHRDILILRGAWLNRGGHHPNSLLKNNGDGTFTDVTKSAGIFSLHPTQTASWADINNDGYLDLFIGNETLNNNIHPCELYINQKDGTFREMSEAHGLGKINAFVKGVTFGDINNDGWQDLYISVMGGPNKLYKNQKGRFVDISAQAGVQQPIQSFPCWFWDVNNDGYEDIFVSGYDQNSLNDIAGDYAKELANQKVISEKPRLYINNGNETFSDQTAKYKLDKTMYTMGSNYGDLDNDGWLDFYVGTGAPDFSTVVPNRMFRNVNGEYFEEVTSAGGFGHIQKGHGVGFADFDQDGDQDIYCVLGGAFEGDQFTNVLFENPISDNDWIIIDIQGTTTNKDALGTKIKIQLSDGRSIYHTVSTGGSFGASTISSEIGIPSGTSISSVVIQWTDGTAQTIDNLQSKKKYIITQGKSEAQEVAYQPLVFSKKDHGHHHHH